MKKENSINEKVYTMAKVGNTYKRADSGLTNPQQWFQDALNEGGSSYTGAVVNRDSAMSISAVFSCIRVLSEAVSSLPLFIYKRTKEGKRKAPEHLLYNVLHSIPNKEMSSMQMREAMMTQLLLYGNAYAQIIRNRADKVVGLYPIVSERVGLRRIDGQLLYVIENAPKEFYTNKEIFHVKGLSFDGISGMSVLKYGKQSMGMSLGVRQYGANLFSNGARPSGIIEHPGKVSDQAAKNLSESWNRQYQGLDNSNKTAILEEGAKFNPISIPPEDAQFIQTQKFTVEEIARLYNVPLHMIGYLDKATFSNIENQSIGFVVNTLRPWLVRWEQEISRTLLTEKEREDFYAEHVVDGLLRGDSKTRNEAYAIGRNNGWLSANEIRELENKNSIGEQGDIYLVPLNMVPASTLLDDPVEPDEVVEETEENRSVSKDKIREFRVKASKSRLRLRENFKGLFLNAAESIVKKETNDLKKASVKHLQTRNVDSFITFLEEYYEKHKKFIIKKMKPVLTVYSKEIVEAARQEVNGRKITYEERNQWVNDYLDTFIKRHIGANKGQLNKLIRENPENEIEVINERLNQWEDKMPDKIADREPIQSEGFLAKGVFILAGVTHLRWQTSSDPCPLCQSLSGQVVGISHSFLNSGDKVKGGEGQEDLYASGNISYAPLHKGCNCSVVPD